MRALALGICSPTQPTALVGLQVITIADFILSVSNDGVGFSSALFATKNARWRSLMVFLMGFFGKSMSQRLKQLL